MNKKEIRDRMKEQRGRLLTLDICRLSRPAIDNVLGLPEFCTADAIYTYMEFGQEIITHPIMSKAWETGKRVAVPKIVNKAMEFYYIEDFDDVMPGYMGILEPIESEIARDENALVIMPGLAFDPDFNRIGYGGGFYDSFFAAHSKTHFTKAALCYDFQIVESIEHEEHDVPVDIIVTPTKVYRRQ